MGGQPVEGLQRVGQGLGVKQDFRFCLWGFANSPASAATELVCAGVSRLKLNGLLNLCTLQHRSRNSLKSRAVHEDCEDGLHIPNLPEAQALQRLRCIPVRHNWQFLGTEQKCLVTELHSPSRTPPVMQV